MLNLDQAMTPEDVTTGELVRVLSQQEEREEEVAEAVVHLLNLAVVMHVGNASLHCVLCNCWDGHDVDGHCPVLSLESWLEAHSS